MTKSLNRRHTMRKRSSIKLEALYSPDCLEFDFGYLRANEIDTLLSPQCPRSADLKVPTPYSDHDEIRLFEPLRPTFLGLSGTPLPTELQILF